MFIYKHLPTADSSGFWQGAAGPCSRGGHLDRRMAAIRSKRGQSPGYCQCATPFQTNRLGMERGPRPPPISPGPAKGSENWVAGHRCTRRKKTLAGGCGRNTSWFKFVRLSAGRFVTSDQTGAPTLGVCCNWNVAEGTSQDSFSPLLTAPARSAGAGVVRRTQTPPAEAAAKTVFPSALEARQLRYQWSAGALFEVQVVPESLDE